MSQIGPFERDVLNRLWKKLRDFIHITIIVSHYILNEYLLVYMVGWYCLDNIRTVASKMLTNPIHTMTDAFSYEHLPSNIHQLNLHNGSREAYEQCFARLDQIFANSSPKEPLLLLSVVHEFDVQRVSDLWQFSRKLLINHPQKRPLFNAVVYDSSATFSLLITAMSQIASIFGARIYFCRHDELDKAVAWLMDVSSAP